MEKKKRKWASSTLSLCHFGYQPLFNSTKKIPCSLHLKIYPYHSKSETQNITHFMEESVANTEVGNLNLSPYEGQIRTHVLCFSNNWTHFKNFFFSCSYTCSPRMDKVTATDGVQRTGMWDKLQYFYPIQRQGNLLWESEGWFHFPSFPVLY